MQERCVIVDGHSLMYRAFHALPLMDADGVYTNAVHGFLSMLLRVFREQRPQYCAVAFDDHTPTFRHEGYEAYKAGRSPMPEELRPQFPLIQELLSAMGIGVVILLLVFAMSMQNITFLVKVQAFCLFANIATTLLTAVLVLTSGHWSISNLAGMFNFSNIETTGGIPGWIIGMALLITPYFGFETVPQMVEEGDFPISNTKKAICGSVLTCGVIYAIFFFSNTLIAPEVLDVLSVKARILAQGAAEEVR